LKFQALQVDQQRGIAEIAYLKTLQRISTLG